MKILALAWLPIALVAAGSGAQAQSLPAVWQNWLTQLSSAGYGIAQGSATVTSVAYCQQVVVPVFGTCFSSDPGDPYVLPLMPVGAGYVDPYYGGVGSETLPDGTVVGESFRLARTEAELVIVQLPPLAAYFSYQGYVFSRLASTYARKPQVLSPDPARGELYASYNNSINNTDIIRQSGLSFGQGYVAFITTPNPALAADMTSQFAAVGGSPSLLFADPIGARVNPGLDASSDDFSMLIRYLVPQSSTAGTAWLDNAGNNVLVYRIDQPASLTTGKYGLQALLKRSYNTNETIYASDIAELTHIMKVWLTTQETKSLYNVKQAITTVKANAKGIPTSGAIGPGCIQFGALCNGDEQDAIHWAVSVGPIPDGGLFIVDGVNSAVTNNATSFSLAVEDGTIKTGVLTVDQTNAAAAGFSDGTITGSAQLALMTLGLWSQASPSLQHDAPNLFVRVFTRGCTTQAYCGQSFTTVVPSTVIPYDHSISIFPRAYGLPGYNGGPNPSHYILSPYAVF